MIDEEERRGNVLLWDLIVKNDDICFKHIIPRLDSNDVKFFYEVNSETSKLIKRSSRERDLKKWFHIEEMSSISTLEVAWKHYSWGDYDHDCDIDWDEPRFCSLVPKTNKLELLKWVREEKKCDWDEWTINRAAEQGNLEMVKYCVANECPINMNACAYAAQGGHLEVLKYLHEEVKAPLNSLTASFAALNGHLHILEYLVEREYDEYNEGACTFAAMNGHLDCLKYLRETAKAPWDSEAVRKAHTKNQIDCVQYLLDNDCPLPSGWSYEGGKLYTSR